jgi:hypothetical protein
MEATMKFGSVCSALGIGTLLVMQLGGSCATDVNVHDDQVEHVYAAPPPPPPVRQDVYVYHDAPPPPVVYHDAPPPVVVYDNDHHDHDYEHHHDDHWPSGIPRGAIEERHEEGKIRWTADGNGTFYVYDVNKDFVRYSGPVHRGQEVIVMPGDDIVYVDQRAVSHENLQRDNTHRIYFLPGVRDNVTEADRGYGEKKGGAGDPGRTIPKGAARFTTGKGDLVINAAKRAGTVYVYDEDNRNVIYTADIDRGNSFKYEDAKGFIYVNSKRIASVKVPKGHTLSLYFGEH